LENKASKKKDLINTRVKKKRREIGGKNAQYKNISKGQQQNRIQEWWIKYPHEDNLKGGGGGGTWFPAVQIKGEWKVFLNGGWHTGGGE